MDRERRTGYELVNWHLAIRALDRRYLGYQRSMADCEMGRHDVGRQIVDELDRHPTLGRQSLVGEPLVWESLVGEPMVWESLVGEPMVVKAACLITERPL